MHTSGFIFLRLLALIVIALISAACTREPLPSPSCRVNANYLSTHQGPSACIIRINNKMLALQLNNERYDLAVSQNLSNQSSQCAAHSETWHQTGLNIEVENVVGIHPDGTWLFGCKLNAGFDGSEPPFDVPAWSTGTAKKVAFIDPFSLDIHNWQQPDQFITVRDAFVAQGRYQQNQTNR